MSVHATTTATGGGEPNGRVEVDLYCDLFLEVFDQSGTPKSACVVLTAAEAREIAQALTEAAERMES